MPRTFAQRARIAHAFTSSLLFTTVASADPPGGDVPTASPPPPIAPPAAEPLVVEPPASEVTVVGTRVQRTPGSAHVISTRQLERFEYDDAQAILQQVPGVYVRQEDGVGLRPNIAIRGANPDRSKKLTLMEDGILFGPAPYSAPAAYYFPLMTRMTYVRVIKGPAAIAFGPHTVGGAIDFVSRPIPDHPAAAVDVGVGEYGYGKVHAHAGTSDDRIGFLIEGVRLWNTGFKALPNGGDTGSTRDDFMVKASYVLDPRARDRQELGLKLGYADEVSNESYLGLTDADFRKNPYQRYAASALDQMKNHRTSIVLTHRFERGRLKLKTDVYRNDYARIWRKFNRLDRAGAAAVLADPTDPVNQEYLAVLRGGDARADPEAGTGDDLLWIGPNDRTFVSQGVQSLLSFEFEQGPVSQRLELGFRLHHDRIDRRHSENAFVMLGGELVPANRATSYTVVNVAQSDALALHVVDAASFGPLTVTPGARIELIRSVEDDRIEQTHAAGLVRAFMPGIGAYYGVTSTLGLLAGVHRGFSPPPPASGPEVRPEYSVNHEGGFRFSDGPARAELIGFFNDYSNMTDVCSAASGCAPEDIDRQFDAGAAHIVGLEAYAAHELPLGAGLKLPFTLAYTLTRGTFESSFESDAPGYGVVQAGDELPYIPRHQLSATAGLEHARGGGVIAVSYVSPMREQAGSEALSETVVTDEQFLVDLGGRARLWGPLSLYANVRNLLGGEFIVSRRPFGARPNAPRWIQLGAKVEL
jgi:Fe(3+) dicitrate transport protein